VQGKHNRWRDGKNVHRNHADMQCNGPKTVKAGSSQESSPLVAPCGNIVCSIMSIMIIGVCGKSPTFKATFPIIKTNYKAGLPLNSRYIAY